MLKVSVIIAVRNEGAWLRNTLKSLVENAGYANYDILIVDDYSTDNCCCNLSDCRILKSTYKPGLAFARQFGFDNTDSDLFFITDGHMSFSRNWLGELVELHKQHPESFISCATAGLESMEILETYSLKGLGFNTPQFIKALKDNIRLDTPTVLRCPINDEHYSLVHQLRNEFNISALHDATLQDYELAYIGSDLKLSPRDGSRNACNYLQLLAGSGYHIAPSLFYRYNHTSPNPFIRANGLLGACYLYPRQLFKQICYGWPKIEKFFFIEPYMSVCAGLCEIPILYSTKATIAHNYHRPYRLMGENYISQMSYGQELTLFITTDTLTDLVFEKVVYRPVAEQYPDWVYEYKQNILKQRKLTDEDFFSLNGLTSLFK